VETEIHIPCVVPARTLWRTQYAPALLWLGENRQKLVWASRKEVTLNLQAADAEELTGTLRARLVRVECDALIVSLRTRGNTLEISVPKSLLNDAMTSA